MINYESTAGPFSHSKNSSVRIMYTVILTLIPALAFGVFQFGLHSLYIIVVCCLSSVVTEFLCLRVMSRKPSASMDGSGILTALLLAISLPPTAPLWLCVLGCVFAIVVGKQIYGGLGQNLFNPAMLARVMLLICFPVEMTNWVNPAQVGMDIDKLFILQDWLEFEGVSAATALSGVVQKQTDVITLFVGTHSGSLGETSTLLIMLGGLYLLYRRIIHWAIPLSFIVGLGVPALISSLIDPSVFLPFSTHLFSGAAMLCAFYIATDMVTSPTSVQGQLLYGCGSGLLVWLIRSFGSYPEGVAFAVLIMNAVSPLIDYYIRPKIFGSKAGATK